MFTDFGTVKKASIVISSVHCKHCISEGLVTKGKGKAAAAKRPAKRGIKTVSRSQKKTNNELAEWLKGHNEKCGITILFCMPNILLTIHTTQHELQM